MGLGSCALMHDKTLVNVEREFLIAWKGSWEIGHKNMESSVAWGHTYFCKPDNTNLQKVLKTMIQFVRTWNIDTCEYNIDLNGK
jgi:hypothetical protein